MGCGAIGLPELLIILAIVVLLFGASRLPQLGKALGETVRNFKKGSDGPEKLPAEPEVRPMPAHETAELVTDEEPKKIEEKSSSKEG